MQLMLKLPNLKNIYFAQENYPVRTLRLQSKVLRISVMLELGFLSTWFIHFLHIPSIRYKPWRADFSLVQSVAEIGSGFSC